MPKGPEPISNILAELMARRGFARVQSGAALEAAWKQVAGPMASYTRVGSIRRGKLEVTVSHSALVQELTFRKTELVRELKKLLPDEKISDLRFRVGPVQ
jgi:predicted nucleic acid-binding Zn ribbon protein